MKRKVFYYVFGVIALFVTAYVLFANSELGEKGKDAIARLDPSSTTSATVRVDESSRRTTVIDSQKDARQYPLLSTLNIDVNSAPPVQNFELNAIDQEGSLPLASEFGDTFAVPSDWPDAMEAAAQGLVLYGTPDPSKDSEGQRAMTPDLYEDWQAVFENSYEQGSTRVVNLYVAQPFEARTGFFGGQCVFEKTTGERQLFVCEAIASNVAGRWVLSGVRFTR